MTERRGWPWVTIALAVINVAVFGWELSAGADPIEPSAQWIVEHGGNLGSLTFGEHEPWRLLTSMFLHIGLLHIAMNMVGLIDGGRHVERMYGRFGFIALYLVSGLVGSLASALRSNDTHIVSAGASGAIFGVFGAFGAFLLLHRDRLDAQQVSKQARGLLVFLAYNVYFGVTAKGIDLVAHLGGLAAGFVVGLALEYGTSKDASTPRRSLIVGVLGVALIFGATQVIHTPPDAIANLRAVELEVNTRRQQLITAAQSGAMTEAAVADVVDNEILPKWHAAREAYERDGEGDSYGDIVKYLRMREDGYKLFAKAFRTDDVDVMQQANKSFEDANTLIESINKRNH